MKILIVHAHENPESFCSALKNVLVQTALDTGHEVMVSDLYAMNFNPIGSKNDFRQLSDNPYYKYQHEQWHAAEHDLFAPDVKNEMKKLMASDFLIFTFPLWWFHLPAILKGWVDRILAYGFSYGGSVGVYDAAAFTGKKAMAVFTTGGPESLYLSNGKHKLDKQTLVGLINHNIFAFNGFDPLPPYMVFGASRITETEREKHLEILKNHFLAHLKP